VGVRSAVHCSCWPPSWVSYTWDESLHTPWWQRSKTEHRTIDPACNTPQSTTQCLRDKFSSNPAKHTSILINNSELNSYWEANSRSANQENGQLLWNPNIPTSFRYIPFHNILLSMPWSAKYSFPFRVLHFRILYALPTTPTPHPSIFSFLIWQPWMYNSPHKMTNVTNWCAVHFQLPYEFRNFWTEIVNSVCPLLFKILYLCPDSNCYIRKCFTIPVTSSPIFTM
jgi:hypothetical protein